MRNGSLWLRATVYLRVHRWTDWALLAAVLLGYGVITRLMTLSVVLDKWANAWQQTWWVVLLGLLLGALEDLCVCVCMCATLWTFDFLTLKSPAERHETARKRRQRQEALANKDRAVDEELGLQSRSLEDEAPAWMEVVELTEQFGRLAVYSLVFLLAAGGLCLDSVFLRGRKMRFSADFVAMYIRERDAAGELEIDDEEWRVLFWTTAFTVVVSLVVGLLGACWINLTEWDALRFLHRSPLYQRCVAVGIANSNYDRLNGKDDEDDDSESEEDSDDSDGEYSECTEICPPIPWSSLRLTPETLLIILIVGLFITTLALAKTLPTIVGLIALNPVLSEPVRLSTGVQFVATSSASGSLKPMSAFIEQETELSQIFDENSLYRRTLAFDGPLAFDIKVGRDERPNVLLLVMESFRMQDSQFLLNSGVAGGIEAVTASLLPENVTLTPNFDRWASRGVALRNLWSTWRTSRSLETLLFGQLPYDSVTETGTTSGHTSTNLSGLPQLFKAKGYDTMFTTGTRLDYDSWDEFLPSHGFDSVTDHWGVVDIIEDEMKLDWDQGNHMLTYWGIHDDMSYTALSHILRKRQFAKNVAKQRAEQEAMAGKIKTRSNETEQALPETNVSTNPWFATHYTISNHVPFNERPDWFFRYANEHRAEMATFAPLYKGHEHEELIRDYVEMRFFSDMVFGAFMEQLEKEGVLKDTIVVVVGDHGQAPERGSATPEQDQIATSRIAGAIIAEGRIQQPVVIEDSGIGRSLKRVPPKGFGKLVAFSNNPATNLAAMLGHLRLHFFADGSDAVRAYHTQRDPHQKHDLMGELPSERVRELLQICDDGRALNAYFKHRWDHNCLLQPKC
ncbi:hypothetical protein PHYBOEH_003797 [Phytophthora boehmeriae]|uniref:Sulfatase N-terminal domain-containing protein n=1 Tax=Phytophthora boehmeriae TaxID=109152 RepID=A0A8T1WSY2_9STRA|nr:hypothetical protein PHYBOEH_003797 [Phytophthora boehmeriae]